MPQHDTEVSQNNDDDILKYNETIRQNIQTAQQQLLNYRNGLPYELTSQDSIKEQQLLRSGFQKTLKNFEQAQQFMVDKNIPLPPDISNDAKEIRSNIIIILRNCENDLLVSLKNQYDAVSQQTMQLVEQYNNNQIMVNRPIKDCIQDLDTSLRLQKDLSFIKWNTPYFPSTKSLLLPYRRLNNNINSLLECQNNLITKQYDAMPGLS